MTWGTVAGLFVVLLPFAILIYLVWRYGTPRDSRAVVRRKELIAGRIKYLEARVTVTNVQDIINKYSGGLDTIGQAMYDEVQTTLNNYWKDSK